MKLLDLMTCCRLLRSGLFSAGTSHLTKDHHLMVGSHPALLKSTTVHRCMFYVFYKCDCSDCTSLTMLVSFFPRLTFLQVIQFTCLLSRVVQKILLLVMTKLPAKKLICWRFFLPRLMAACHIVGHDKTNQITRSYSLSFTNVVSEHCEITWILIT